MGVKIATSTLLAMQAAEKVRAQEAPESYAKAKDFFYATPLLNARAVAPPPPPESYASDQGTIQFHLFGHKPEDAAYSDMMNQNGNNLLAIGGLVHDYMQRLYPTVNSAKLDLTTWFKVIYHIPHLTFFKKTAPPPYSLLVHRASVSGEFLGIIASAILAGDGSLLTDFNSFLRAIGSAGFSGYKALTCTFQNYIIVRENSYWYDYGAIFLRKFEFTEMGDQMNIKYTEMGTLVSTRQIRHGGKNYHAFQGLVNANATEQFKSAKNFFDAGNTPQADLRPVV
jgi:hypothetical protein